MEKGKGEPIAFKLFVGNLNFKTTQSEIEDLFSEVGDVVEVIVPTERGTGRPRGFAFVEYEDGDAMAEAIEKFNGYELGGRELRVNEATERPPRRPSFGSDDFGGGGFGGFGGGKPPRGGKPKGSRRNLRGKKRSL